MLLSPLLSVTDTGGGTVRLSSAYAVPRHVAASIQPHTDEAPTITLTSGGCEAGYATITLSFSGAAKRAVTEDSTDREVPSSKVART
jgi:hypothetical protein